MKLKQTRFVFITGGVISGIGKGITSASLGRLLISQGFSVFPIKTDPYLNEDAGTMNPMQHGEVFVTDDGAETDLDLGHYERFMSLSLDKRSNFTSGSVYRSVLDKERRGDFLGKTIQVVPHITDEIQSRIMAVAEEEKPDFMLVEIGGTMGADIEIQPFAEAMRQLKLKVGDENFASVHVVKMDYVFPSDEAKTKPIQHSVRAMMGLGLSPDILVVRAKRPVDKDDMDKIAMFCSVPRNKVTPALDARNIYEIPISLEENGFLDAFLGHFGMKRKEKDLVEWRAKYKRFIGSKKEVIIGVVGKYHGQSDAYISVNEALVHGGAGNGVRVKIVPIDSERSDIKEAVKNVHGIVVPGGYGSRGVKGMIEAIKTAREEKIPFLGLCYGMQMAVIERARNVIGHQDADTTEINKKTSYPVIDILEGQKNEKKMGGSQRLGSYPAIIRKGTFTAKIYGISGGGKVDERHRHRYEVNPKCHEDLEKSGLAISGRSPDGKLAEFIEIPPKDHPFFIATQAHPELKSRFMEPHPLFLAFIKEAFRNLQ
ncbi:MAG: CTP synthase [Candidatus Colwellbacteria bacterium]|nr:CTP synthase [Candidatus Colwellbacteria bacterium]